MSSAESAAATSRVNPLNTRRSPRPSARACASSAPCSSPSPTMKTRTRGMAWRRSPARRRQDTRLPFAGISRVIVPIAMVPGAMPSAAARAGDLRRAPRPRELVERRAEIDHLGALGRHQPRARRELARSIRTPQSPGRCAAPAADRRPSGTTACRRDWRARAGSPECPSATRTAGRTSSRRSRACARCRRASRAAPSAAP